MRAPGKYKFSEALAEQGIDPSYKHKYTKPFSLLIFLRLYPYLPIEKPCPN